MPQQQPEIWSVSQVTRRVKQLLEHEISYIWVSGEISNWRVSPAGHAYFTLKDKDSQLDAVMFRGKLMRLKFGPESGIEVIVHGMVTVYERRGNYQIICDDMQPKGMGALQLAFEKLRKKLESEGLFEEDHRKPIPLLPKRIGIVTSPTGAAIRDMLNVLNRRFANVNVLLYPARVQGDEAAEEMVAGIQALHEWGVDVIIIGRGGGSLEDLWPFNEEVLVRAVYDVETPIISAVGHEIDFALTDFAADLRAPTPSAAAELVVQERDALTAQIRGLEQRLGNAVSATIERTRRCLDQARACYVFQRPEELVRQRRQESDDLRMRLESALYERGAEARQRLDVASRAMALLSPVRQLQRTCDTLRALKKRLGHAGQASTSAIRARFQTAAARLDALSPLKILGRGYALALKLPEGTVVYDSALLEPEDLISLRFGKGSATASITETHKDG